MQGNPAPRRGEGQEVAETLTRGFGDRGLDLDQIAGGGYALGKTCSGKDSFGTLMANCGTKQWLGNQEALSGDYHVFALAGNTIGRKPENGGNHTGYDDSGVSYTLTKADQHGVCYGFNWQDNHAFNAHVETTNPLRVSQTEAVAHTFKVRGGCECGGKGYLGSDESAFTLSTNQDQHLFHNMQVRRLMPMECERLQGFPDNYTRIDEKTKDGPRYQALGNSMAVPVMRWIGERIQMVENISEVPA